MSFAPPSAETPSILIVELGSNELRAQFLHYGRPAGILVAILPGDLRINVVHAPSEASLRAQVRDLRKSRRRFRTVFVVTHSTEYGPETGGGGAMDWASLGKLLAPFRPSELLLLACHAGRSSVGRALFDVVPTLRDIIASPVAAYRPFANAIVTALPMLLVLRAPMWMVASSLRAAVFMEEGGQVRHWRRGDFDDDRATLLDEAADLLDEPLRRGSLAHRRWLDRLFAKRAARAR